MRTERARDRSRNRRTAESKEKQIMSTITTKDGTQIYVKDWGPKNAQPIMFHHGWPLSADDWDAQMLFFLGKGYRVVAHDRRGDGRSSQVRAGHDRQPDGALRLIAYSYGFPSARRHESPPPA
jgi:non-heme chloroperoxidase